MKNKDKKTILNLVALAAVAFSVATLFTPVASWNLLDIYKDAGVDNPCEFGLSYWSTEVSTLFIRLKHTDDNITVYNHLFFAFIPIASEGWEQRYIGESKVTNYEFSIDPQVPSSRATTVMSTIVFGVVLLVLLLYTTLKGFKYCEVKKTKWFFYSGFITISMGIGLLITVFFDINYFDNWPHGNYTDYIRLEYGFFYIVISSVLFFTAYIIQNYFIDFSKDKPEIEKNLFEKYKK